MRSNCALCLSALNSQKRNDFPQILILNYFIFYFDLNKRKYKSNYLFHEIILTVINDCNRI